MTESAVRKSVLMYPTDVRIIERVAERYGLNDFSTAIRFIVRKWDEVQTPIQSISTDDFTPSPTAGD